MKSDTTEFEAEKLGCSHEKLLRPKTIKGLKTVK